MKKLAKRLSFLVVMLICVSITGIVYGSDSLEEELLIGLKSMQKSKYVSQIKSNGGFEFGKFEGTEFKREFLIEAKELSARFYPNGEGVEQPENAEEKVIKEVYYIKVNSEFDSFEVADTVAREYRGQGYSSFVHIKASGKYEVVVSLYEDKEKTDSEFEILRNNDVKIEKGEDVKIVILKEEKPVAMFDNEVFIWAKPVLENDKITVEKLKYRGFISFSSYRDSIIAVNKVKLNEYLYGVVPGEVYISWKEEALKAQAVAARNYAVQGKNRFKQYGFDLTDNQDSQVYKGFTAEHEKTNKAVDETSNQYIKKNGKLITAFYHSASGGHTENSENIWQNKVSYLRGVDDPYSLGSPHDNWKKAITVEDIEKSLKAHKREVGSVEYINVLKVSDYGRVQELEVVGTDKTEKFKKEEIRKVLGYSNLKSIWFEVSSDADVYVLRGEETAPKKQTMSSMKILSADGLKTFEEIGLKEYNVTDGQNVYKKSTVANTYNFEGKGWGHGLGLSQWGAKGMADQGFNYKQILEYYYTGTKVE